jgi:DNA polymerase
VVDKQKNWGRIKLPSGRYLCYPGIKVKDDKLSYLGRNAISRRFERLKTYGGKLTENIVQASSRDILASGMLNADRNGYAICLTVHDEIVCETLDNDSYSSAELSELMCTAPPWAEGIPLAAAGFDAYRYRK